jgi:hypothetical protein
VSRDPEQTEIGDFTSEHIETFLSNYRHHVLAVMDRAREWLLLDEEERAHHHQEFDRGMGDRHVLGLLHSAGRLTRQQEQVLRRTDRLLVQQASLIAELFGFDVHGGYFELLAEAREPSKETTYPQRELAWQSVREE